MRGLGYVVWYPVAIEAVSMSDGNAVFDAIAAWKQRQAHSEFDARIIVVGAGTEALCIAVNARGLQLRRERAMAATPRAAAS